MWKKYFFISLGFNLVVLGSFLFFSFVNNNNPEEKKSTDQYPVTRVQQQRLDSLKSEMDRQLAPLRIKVLQDRVDLWNAFLEENPDTSKINQLLQILMQDEVRLKEIRYRYYPAEKLTLTHRQRKEQLESPLKKVEATIVKLSEK